MLSELLTVFVVLVVLVMRKWVMERIQYELEDEKLEEEKEFEK